MSLKGLLYDGHRRMKKATLRLTCLIGAIGFFSSTQVVGQSLPEGDFNIDRSTSRYKELTVAFQAFYGELTHGLLMALSEKDRQLIEHAVTDGSYYRKSIQLMETACDYFNNATDESAIDVSYVAGIFDAANQSEYEDQEAFLELNYQALSAAAKGRFDQLIDIHAYAVSGMNVRSFDIQKLAREAVRETTLEHIAARCERLPAVIEMFSGEKLPTRESAIDLRGEQQ